MIMKKLFYVVLLVIFIFVFVGCGGRVEPMEIYVSSAENDTIQETFDTNKEEFDGNKILPISNEGRTHFNGISFILPENTLYAIDGDVFIVEIGNSIVAINSPFPSMDDDISNPLETTARWMFETMLEEHFAERRPVMGDSSFRFPYPTIRANYDMTLDGIAGAGTSYLIFGEEKNIMVHIFYPQRIVSLEHINATVDFVMSISFE